MKGNMLLAFMFQPEMQQKGKYFANFINISVFENNKEQSEMKAVTAVTAHHYGYSQDKIYYRRKPSKSEWEWEFSIYGGSGI